MSYHVLDVWHKDSDSPVLKGLAVLLCALLGSWRCVFANFDDVCLAAHKPSIFSWRMQRARSTNMAWLVAMWLRSDETGLVACIITHLAGRNYQGRWSQCWCLIAPLISVTGTNSLRLISCKKVQQYPLQIVIMGRNQK